MTPAEALRVLKLMRESRTGAPGIRQREERQALDVAIEVLFKAIARGLS